MKIMNTIHQIPKLFKGILSSGIFTSHCNPPHSLKSHIFIIISIVIMLLFMKHSHSDDSTCSSSCSSSSSSSCSSCNSSPCSCSCQSDESSSSSSSSSSNSHNHHHHNHNQNGCDRCGCGDCQCEPYGDNGKDLICNNYKRWCCPETCYLDIIVKSDQLCIPQYILRTIPYCVNFYYTFNIPGLDNCTINSMIMLKDLLQWMSSGVSLSADILPDKLYPVMFIYKTPCGKVNCGEYLRIFVSTDDCGKRTAFVSKGKDYLCVYSYIYQLLIGCSDCPLIYDLLNGNEYYTYDISESCPVSLLQFLMALLSLYLIPDCLIGQQIIYDVSYCHETKLQLEYFYQYFNCECNVSTVIC